MPSIIGPSVRQRTDREDRALWPAACSCLFVPMLAGTPTTLFKSGAMDDRMLWIQTPDSVLERLPASINEAILVLKGS
jgi:hypothetical protein